MPLEVENRIVKRVENHEEFDAVLELDFPLVCQLVEQCILLVQERARRR